MPALNLTLAGSNGAAHNWTHVSVPFGEIQTLINTTKLDYLNVQTNGIRTTQMRSFSYALHGQTKVRNATGGTLAANTIVSQTEGYSDGTDTYPKVVKSDSAAVGSWIPADGILTASVANGADGTLAKVFEITGINTSARTLHDPVYLSETAGGYTFTKPVFPSVVQIIGRVTEDHASTGRILFDLPGMLEHPLDATAALAITNTFTVGVNDTGHDVKFFGAAAGAFSLWDESVNKQIIQGATAAGAGTLLLSTGELTNVDGGILGRIDFAAPLDNAGTDAILTGASIWAEADDTFSSSLNDTDLVFAVAESEAALERMRLSYDGTNVGLLFSGATTIGAGGALITFNGAITSDGAVTGTTLAGTVSTAAQNSITAATALASVGALNSGSITSGFANINNGSSTLDTGAATLASLTCTAAGTFGGGYGATGATISTAGVIQANGAITSDGAVTGATLAGTVSTATQNSITTATSLASVGTITSGTWSGVIDGSCTMTVGSDATGDVYFRDASGFLERLAASTDGHVLTSTGAGSIPAWEAVPAGTSLSGTTNNTIVTVTGANALLGEANLTFDGTTLEVVNDGSAAQLKLTDNGVGYATIESDNRTILIGENGNAAVQIGDGSANYPMYIGDTANGNMTTGITINQGAADNELFALKSSDVAHGMTGQTETDTYGYIKKFSATLGGVKFGGLSESATAMELTANATTPQTTDTTGSEGIFHFRANKANGTAVQDLGDTDNLCCMVNNNTTRFVLKGNGTLHITNTTLVALDFEDDNQLVRAMQRESSVEGSLLESEYDNPFYSHSKLMEHGLAGEKDEKGEFFVPLQNRLHAHEGAMWQTYCEVKDMKMKIEERDTKIAALEQRLNLIESN
jgi:hypothetical protein